jgi:hypothetical protein
MTTSTARLKRIPSPHCSIAKMTPSTFGCRILPRSVAGSCPSYQPRLIACITAPHLYGRDGGARARPQPPPPRRRIKCEPSTRRASGPTPARPAPAMRPHARPAPALRPHAQLAPPAHQPARTRQPARASPPALARRSDPARGSWRSAPRASTPCSASANPPHPPLGLHRAKSNPPSPPLAPLVPPPSWGAVEQQWAAGPKRTARLASTVARRSAGRGRGLMRTPSRARAGGVVIRSNARGRSSAGAGGVSVPTCVY